MIEIIQYKDINKFKKFLSFDLNTNSKLYFNKDLIHKVLNENLINLKQILEYLDKLKLEELVEIKNLIYNNNNMIGYSIKRYKKYKSLEKLKKRPFELKKRDCFKLVETYSKLLKNNLYYKDFHLGNILLNKKTSDIKICDLDSFDFINGENNIKALLVLILSYLYGIRYCDIDNILKTSGIKNDNLFINKCCLNERDITCDKIFEIINDMQKEYIVNEKKLIVNRSKELCETGYSKFLRY